MAPDADPEVPVVVPEHHMNARINDGSLPPLVRPGSQMASEVDAPEPGVE